MTRFLPALIFRSLCIVGFSSLLISCATSHDVIHAYKGPALAESELALLAGLQRKGAGMEFYSVDGEVLDSVLTSPPVAIYLKPGRHFLAVNWSSQELIGKRTVRYEVRRAYFDTYFHAGHRYVAMFRLADASAGVDFGMWILNVDTAEVFLPEGPYQSIQSGDIQ